MFLPAEVTVEIETPGTGTGNILTAAGLGAVSDVGGEQVDARSSTLIALEQAQGVPLVPTSSNVVTLHDDDHDGDGAFEPDGIFGHPLEGVTRFEGNYRFHAKARYGDDRVGTREAAWSIYVEVGIDAGATDVSVTTVTTLPGGATDWRGKVIERERSRR